MHQLARAGYETHTTDAKQDLRDGAHVSRHSEGTAAVSSNQFREQAYIKQGKQAGGIKNVHNLEAVFACLLIVGQKRNLELPTFFHYEL